MSRQRGFTLLEVMVATAILGTSLAVISAGLSLAVRSTALATGYERARQVAETELASYLAARPDRGGQNKGNTDGIRWRLRAEPDPDQEGLLRVIIEARFFTAGGDRAVILETREVDRALPETTTETTGAT